MTQPTSVQILSGYATLDDVAALTSFCRACARLLGDEPALTGIGEDPTAVQISPFSQFEISRWDQGRLFGRRGEVRWRRYGLLLRAALLIEVDSVAAADKIRATLAELDISWQDVQAAAMTISSLFLQTNDDSYTEAQVHRYTVGGEADFFMRYACC